MEIEDYIIKLYNNDKFIYYIYSFEGVGVDINYAEKYSKRHIAADNGQLMIDRLFAKHSKNSMSKHTFDHLREDHFDGIRKRNLSYKIIRYNFENRLLKLEKINKIIDER